MIENPVPWPNGARVAVAITFDIDADSILHIDHRANAHRMVAAQSLLRYDRIVVRRAGHAQDGEWMLVSEHPAWESVPWAEDTEIIGQVVWMARSLM